MKYEVKLNAILSEYGSKVITEILDQPCVDSEGKFDTPLATLKLRALKQLEDRLQGTPIQRSETKELRVNIGQDMSITEINRRIAELDKELKGGRHDTIIKAIRERGEDTCEYRPLGSDKGDSEGE
jgi:hypothetical protein